MEILWMCQLSWILRYHRTHYCIKGWIRPVYEFPGDIYRQRLNAFPNDSYFKVFRVHCGLANFMSNRKQDHLRRPWHDSYKRKTFIKIHPVNTLKIDFNTCLWDELDCSSGNSNSSNYNKRHDSSDNDNEHCLHYIWTCTWSIWSCW